VKGRCSRTGLKPAIVVLSCVVGLAGPPAVASAQERSSEHRARPVRAPGLSFLFSVILPGTGQLYNGDRRGFLYLGAEAASWFGRFSYKDAAAREEDQYRAFAARHWSFEDYRCEPSDGTSCEDCATAYDAVSDATITDLAENDPSTFHDEIGRNDAYRWGWDDACEGGLPNGGSENRARYRRMMRESDKYEDRARLFAVGLALNRIVSGIDAYQTARGRRASSSSDRAEAIREGGRDAGASHAHPWARLEGGLRGGFRSPEVVLCLTRALY